MSFILAIDPGIKGCAVSIHLPSLNLQFFSISNKKEYQRLHQWVLLNKNSIVGVALEKVRGIYGVSSKATFSFGYEYGKITQLLEVNSLAITYVLPTRWHKFHAIKGIGKGSARKTSIKKQVATKAAKLYPSYKSSFYGPRGGLLDGRSDALLLGTYFLKTFYKGKIMSKDKKVTTKQLHTALEQLKANLASAFLRIEKLEGTTRDASGKKDKATKDKSSKKSKKDKSSNAGVGVSKDSRENVVALATLLKEKGWVTFRANMLENTLKDRVRETMDKVYADDKTKEVYEDLIAENQELVDAVFPSKSKGGKDELSKNTSSKDKDSKSKDKKSKSKKKSKKTKSKKDKDTDVNGIDVAKLQEKADKKKAKKAKKNKKAKKSKKK